MDTTGLLSRLGLFSEVVSSLLVLNEGVQVELDDRVRSACLVWPSRIVLHASFRHAYVLDTTVCIILLSHMCIP